MAYFNSYYEYVLIKVPRLGKSLLKGCPYPFILCYLTPDCASDFSDHIIRTSSGSLPLSFP